MRLKILCATTIFSLALFAQAGPSSSKSKTESGNGPIQAEKLLKEIKANADQIRSSALTLEKLAMEANAQWSDYDRQWNIIKPAQERIDLTMQRLEGMQASLSPTERQAVAQTKKDIDEIADATHDLWMRIGQQRVDLKAPALKADARRLDKAARELIKEVASTS
jgi:hypothetical protein